MLEYQKQDCDLTLQEGLEPITNHFLNLQKYLKIVRRPALFLEIMTVHMIFGLDISIEQEAILDSWVLWGSKWKLSYLLSYQNLPQLKQLYKDLYKEFGVFGFIKIYWKIGGIKRRVIYRRL